MVPEDVQGVFVCNRGKVDGAAFNILVRSGISRNTVRYIYGTRGIYIFDRVVGAPEEKENT